MNHIVNGQKIAETVYADLGNKINVFKTQGVSPVLEVLLIGQNPASIAYGKIKQKMGQKIGVTVNLRTFRESISVEQVQTEISRFNIDPQVSGIIVQLPLPEKLSGSVVLDTISPDRDVDCLTSANRKLLTRGMAPKYLPPAPAAILKILEVNNINLHNSAVLIVGAGHLVGRPLADMLLQQKIDFQVANQLTENLPDLTRKADVLITGVGKPGLITGEMVKPGAVVIDAGTSEISPGDLRGDVLFEEVSNLASLITPVPGGVGPVTVAMLFQNVVKAAEMKVRA